MTASGADNAAPYFALTIKSSFCKPLICPSTSNIVWRLESRTLWKHFYQLRISRLLRTESPRARSKA